MDLVVQKVIELEPLEWLQHLLHILLQGLHKSLVLYPQHILHQTVVLLLHSLLLFLENRQEYLTFIVLLLYFLRLQVNDLSQEIHAV